MPMQEVVLQFNHTCANGKMMQPQTQWKNSSGCTASVYMPQALEAHKKSEDNQDFGLIYYFALTLALSFYFGTG